MDFLKGLFGNDNDFRDMMLILVMIYIMFGGRIGRLRSDKDDE